MELYTIAENIARGVYSDFQSRVLSGRLSPIRKITLNLLLGKGNIEDLVFATSCLVVESVTESLNHTYIPEINYLTNTIKELNSKNEWLKDELEKQTERMNRYSIIIGSIGEDILLSRREDQPTNMSMWFSYIESLYPRLREKSPLISKLTLQEYMNAIAEMRYYGWLKEVVGEGGVITFTIPVFDKMRGQIRKRLGEEYGPQIAELKHKLEESLKTMMTDKEVSIDTENRISTLRKELEGKDEEIRGLHKKTVEQRREIEELRTSISNYVQIIRDKEEKTSNLEKEISELRKATAQASASEKEESISLEKQLQITEPSDALQLATTLGLYMQQRVSWGVGPTLDSLVSFHLGRINKGRRVPEENYNSQHTNAQSTIEEMKQQGILIEVKDRQEKERIRFNDEGLPRSHY